MEKKLKKIQMALPVIEFPQFDTGKVNLETFFFRFTSCGRDRRMYYHPGEKLAYLPVRLHEFSPRGRRNIIGAKFQRPTIKICNLLRVQI